MSRRRTSIGVEAMSAAASSSELAVPTTWIPSCASRSAAVPSRTTGWSSTIASRITVSAPPPLKRHVGAAGRPAPHVEDRPDALGTLLHVEQPEAPLSLGRRGGVLGDAGPGVVDRQRDPVLGRPIPNDDRRPAVLHGVRQRLLGDAEDR